MYEEGHYTTPDVAERWRSLFLTTVNEIGDSEHHATRTRPLYRQQLALKSRPQLLTKR